MVVENIETTNFTVFNKNLTHTIEDNTLYIEGIANSGLQDLDGDIITTDAMQQIVQQATNHNLHLDHDKSFDGLLGAIVDAKLTPQGVWIKSRILDDKKEFIENLLKQDINLGQSISGNAKRVHKNGKYINDWQLIEISLTPVPCDQNTMGTVQISKSFYDVSKSLNNNIKEIGVNNMADENITITEDKVIELINQALAEKTEETEKIILDKIGADIDAKFGVVDERLKSIESQLETAKEKPVETTEETTETEPETETKPEQENKADDNEETKDDEKEDTETQEKNIQNMIQKQINKSIKDLFKPSFKYDKSTNVEKAINKNGSTPKELARQFFN